MNKQGINLVLDGSADAPIQGLRLYGYSLQDGTPSPSNPVPIVSAGDSGEIEAKVYGGNLISSDISSWNQNGWGGTILQLSDGIKIKTINGWSKVYYDTSEMNGKTLNFSFDYQQIESETTSPSTINAFSIVVQNENEYPTVDNSIFPFQIDSPETVKTHVSVSFTARNYLCFFLRVNTEGVEAGETRAIEVTNIMLNAGSTALAFEPYVTPQTLILSTPGGLPGISVDSGGNYTDENGQQWVCDEIDLARGKYVQRVAIEQKTGNFQMSETADVPGRYHQYGALDTVYKNGGYKSFCNIATWIRLGIEKTETEWKFAISDNGFYLNPPVESGITTADELNAILNSLDFPLVFVGQLETPIETDLPAEEIAAYKALHTYSPTTTVSNDAGAWMYVKYLMNDDIPTGPYANPRSEVAQYYRALAGYDKSYPKSTCRETALIKCLIDGSLDPPFTEAKCTIEAYLLDIINNTRTMMNYEPKCDCEKFLAMMIGKEVVDYPQLNCERNLWMSKCVEKKALTEALRNGLI